MRINFRLLTCLFLTLFASIDLPAIAKEKFIVVIDPGHGGNDTGTTRRRGKKNEKTIALNVALKLGNLIESNYRDVKVVYTRKTDVYPSLPDRVQKAKEAKGNLFISIHVNACPDAAARGFETYVFGVDGSNGSRQRLEERLVEERENLDISGRQINFDTDIDIETKILCQAQREKHNRQSLQVANYVQEELISTLRSTSYGSSVKNRGVKSKNLFVLCFSPMPAILVELGYMSNVAEEAFINTPEAETAFANALFKGFRKYKRDWDQRQLNAQQRQEPEPEPRQTEPQREQPTPQPTQNQPEQRPSQQQPAQTPAGDVTWKIQFLISENLLSNGARQFQGLTGVEHYKDGNTYKYTVGNASSTAQLKDLMRQVKQKFPNAFYVKFDREGKRIQ